MVELPSISMQARPTVELLGRQLNDVEQKYAPDHLYVEGDVALLLPETVRVSLVGSRSASQDGLRRTRKLARLLADSEIVVVSGLAKGIDTAAHRASLDHGGRTIAVLGTGIDRYYPAENRDLQDEIARDHLIVSQFEPGMPPMRRAFPQRNRTMALVCDATVIVEAGEGSGSLHQGWEALRLARPLFIARSVLEAGLSWPEKMLGYGARVLQEVEDLLDLIPSPTPTALAL